jgi:glycine/D-amino acid oxidase-like deaminating enzyme
MTLASSDTELHVLKEALALPDAEQRGFELLDPAAVREVNPALRGEYLGGLWCRTDAIVEPRVAQPALRAHLLSGGNASPRTPASKAGGYQWLPGREAIEIAPNGVRDHTGTWHHGDLVVLCTGAALTGIAGPHLAGFPAPPVRRVRLQMMQTRPLGERLTTSVADGDSLRYYPAYDLPGRHLLPPQTAVAAQARAQLLLVQRADGSLTIGDTHEYDEPFTFDVDEDAYDHLRARAELLLGQPLPPVQRRWAGVYSEVTNPDEHLYLRSEVAPGVLLVTGPGGRGMTCSPAIAEETFE